MTSDFLTSTDLIAYSTDVLEGSGYKVISNDSFNWNSASSRLFENAYNVVGIVAFDTYAELMSSWADRQGLLVDIISSHVGKGEGKAWDGYLVLLTPAVAPTDDDDLEAIRRDTTRLRKLTATGDDLKKAGDVERVLRSLLPIRNIASDSGLESVLDHLSEVLSHRGIDRKDAVVLVEAFLEQRPLVETLHRSRSKE